MYVAHSIEQGQPDLKNSLVNFLFLRGDSHPVHQVVYDALEKRAADLLRPHLRVPAAVAAPVVEKKKGGLFGWFKK